MSQESGIALDTAAIVSTVLEGIVYGFSVMMFFGTIWALTDRRPRSVVNTGMIMVACLMLLLSTAHLVVDIVRTYEGLVEYRDTYYKGPIGFFSDVSQWSFVYKNLIYTLLTLVSDGVVIYRCYVVWQSWWIIVFPIMLWTSVGVTGIGCVYFDSQATGLAKENVFAPTTGRWITAFLADALFTNILCTSLLAFRIWKVGTRMARLSSHTPTVLRPIVRIILDAGILYSVMLLAMLLCFVAKNRGHYVMLDVSVPIMSITFYMVIIRITLSKTTYQGTVQASSSRSGHLTLSRMSRFNKQPKPMEMHITQLTETNEREEYGCSSGEPKMNGETDEEIDLTTRVLGSFAV